jgi:hypothetical protein
MGIPSGVTKLDSCNTFNNPLRPKSGIKVMSHFRVLSATELANREVRLVLKRYAYQSPTGFGKAASAFASSGAVWAEQAEGSIFCPARPKD